MFDKYTFFENLYFKVDLISYNGKLVISQYCIYIKNHAIRWQTRKTVTIAAPSKTNYPERTHSWRRPVVTYGASSPL